MRRSPEETIKSFLVGSPPGEFQQAATALEGLIGDPAPVNAVQAACFKEWSHRNCHTVSINGNPTIISDISQVAENTYVNPYDMHLFRYDFERRRFKPLADEHPSSPARNELQKLFMEYAKNAYMSNVGVGVYDGKCGTLQIILRSSSISLKNFRTGNITARYQLCPDGKLTGNVLIMQHFFENGNVMCSQTAQLDTQVTPGDLKGCVQKVKEFEDAWLAAYLETFNRLSSDGITKLRRKMSVTGTKINWEAEFRGLTGMQGV